MSVIEDEKAKKAAKKAKLRAEAEKLGVSYEALKAQKKDRKKRKGEADKLTEDNDNHDGGIDRRQEQKRMRTWSGENFDEMKKNGVESGAKNGASQPPAKRLRTRSMDKAEENAKIVEAEKSQTTDEWRQLHNITIRGYGKNSSEKNFTDPFIEFSDAPFNPTIQSTLKAAGFDRPTFIQSQVSQFGLVCVYSQAITVSHRYYLTNQYLFR
jgi:hypothetical protein